ncbi:unnamed protein product [Ostreobium quekettii]|uniref:Uncharacterized protein n=1 Tax=Ostreobium quekettii TaxID=121088 RepID=A0A8S1IWQ0_9CHLO|nr:unnamed protein product [Ostreobium quekettii]|eukprot:evm.model.scf_397.2 EVM.evm.TU.scf_397.2   scf_397:18313-24451(-)
MAPRAGAARWLAVCALVASLGVHSEARHALGGADGAGGGRELLQFGFCPPEVGTEAFDFLLTRTTFSHPEVGGGKLDYCTSPGVGCGKPAADAFCVSRGFASAESFFKWRFAIRDCGTTVTIGSGESCSESSCEGFRIIVCRQGGGADTTEPALAASDAVAAAPGPSDLGPLAQGPAGELLNGTSPGLDELPAAGSPPRRPGSGTPASLQPPPKPRELPTAFALAPAPVPGPTETPTVGAVTTPSLPPPPKRPTAAEPPDEEPEEEEKPAKKGKGGKKGRKGKDTSEAFVLRLDETSCSEAGILGAFSAANSACLELSFKCTAGQDGGRRRSLKSVLESNMGLGAMDAQRPHQLRGLLQRRRVKACKDNFMESCLTTASQQTQKIMGTCQDLLLNGPMEPVPGCSSFTEVERIFNAGISTLCAESLDDVLP